MGALHEDVEVLHMYNPFNPSECNATSGRLPFVCDAMSVMSAMSVSSSTKRLQTEGSLPCEHGRKWFFCKGCNGKGICQHQRVRYTCKGCNGKGVCQHQRMRYTCKECKGKGICQNGRIRRQCKECGGRGICQHRRGAASTAEVARVHSQCWDAGSVEGTVSASTGGGAMRVRSAQVSFLDVR